MIDAAPMPLMLRCHTATFRQPHDADELPLDIDASSLY